MWPIVTLAHGVSVPIQIYETHSYGCVFDYMIDRGKTTKKRERRERERERERAIHALKILMVIELIQTLLCLQSLLSFVLGPQRLLTHIHALRRYLLLGQGDLICHLMDVLR